MQVLSYHRSDGPELVKNKWMFLFTRAVCERGAELRSSYRFQQDSHPPEGGAAY